VAYPQGGSSSTVSSGFQKCSFRGRKENRMTQAKTLRARIKTNNKEQIKVLVDFDFRQSVFYEKMRQRKFAMIE